MKEIKTTKRGPVTQVPKKNIYKGVKITHRIYNRKGSESYWALVKQNRNVVEQHGI